MSLTYAELLRRRAFEAKGGDSLLEGSADELDRLAEVEAENGRLARDREVSRELMKALKKLPVLPSPRLLLWLSRAAKFPDDWSVGKRLQHEHGPEAVPPKTECELGAGLWYRIRAALAQTKEPSDD